MATVKVIELIGESNVSWEDAVSSAVGEAAKTIDGLSGVEVLNMTANIEDGKIVGYKVNLNAAFPVKEKR